MNITTVNIDYLKDELRKVIQTLVSGSFSGSPDAVDEVSASFESLIVLFDEVELNGFTELFNYLYFNWTELESYDNDYCIAIQEMLVNSFVLIKAPGQSNKQEMVKNTLQSSQWLLPLDESGSADLLSAVFNDCALLADALEEPISEEALSEEAISEEAISEEAISEEAISEEAISEEAISEEAISGGRHLGGRHLGGRHLGGRHLGGRHLRRSYLRRSYLRRSTFRRSHLNRGNW